MKLAEWISARRHPVAEVARKLGIEGVNPGRTLARLISGEREANAETVSRICALTDGQVGPQDMFQTRIDWLQAHAPEKLAIGVSPFVPEAAE